MTGRAAEELEQARGFERRLVVSLALSGIGMAALAAVALTIDDASLALRETVLWVGWVFGVAGLVALILWLRWFVALYRVAREVGRPRHRPVMAWLGWIVPVVALVVPKRMVDDVWRAGGDDRPLPRAVQSWWAIWFALNALHAYDFVRERVSRSAETPRPLEVALAALYALATPFAVATVYALTDRLEDVAGPGALSAAAPPEPGYATASPT